MIDARYLPFVGRLFIGLHSCGLGIRKAAAGRTRPTKSEPG